MKEPPFHLSECRIAIFGLGLMGGSLGLALRGHCSYILGIDTDDLANQLAIEMEAVDEVVPCLSSTDEVDFIILAVPVLTIIDLINNFDTLYSKPAIILDLGSTKTQISKAMNILPERFDPIGGHPMCGKEYPSIRYAEANLYQNAPFALTPLARTTDRARHISTQLVDVIGAHTLWLDPEIHDLWVAYTSHLPYIIANTLTQVVPIESSGMIGSGFRSTTRLAGGFAPMMLDVLITNKENILMALQDMKDQLDSFSLGIKGEDTSTLFHFLQKAAQKRNLLLDNPDEEGTS